MGKNSFQFALTEKQTRALILSEFIPLPDIIRLILNFTREKQFEDARKERLTLRPEHVFHHPVREPQLLDNKGDLVFGYFHVLLALRPYMRARVMRSRSPNERTAEWWIMRYRMCIDIQCFHPGFMTKCPKNRDLISTCLLKAWLVLATRLSSLSPSLDKRSSVSHWTEPSNTVVSASGSPVIRPRLAFCNSVRTTPRVKPS